MIIKSNCLFLLQITALLTQMGIFRFFLFGIINHSLVILAQDRPYYHCYPNGNISSNGQYMGSRNYQLSELADRVKFNGGFFKGNTISNSPSPTPSCLGLCRKDLVSSDACHTCISSTASEITRSCPVQKEVVAWGADAGCIVQCVPPNTESNTTQPSTYACNTTSLSRNHLSQFNQTLTNLTSKLAVEAADEGSSSAFAVGFSAPQYFATEEAELGDLLTIYAVGFCVPSLSGSDCTACLKTAANSSAVNCNGKQGAKIFMASCVLRYELYPFYKSATTVSVAPSPLVSPSSRKKGRTESRTVVFAVVFPIVVVVILLVFIILIRMVLNRGKQRWDDNGVESIESCFEVSFNTIRVATNDFSESNKLGEGGFGAVYKGRLPNGLLVAVKRLTRTTAHGEEEFKNEVQLVARLHHKNLVRLVGFCVGVKERILIYELAVNGSLDHILFDPNRREILTWNIRYNIVKGIAHGLIYLHEESQLRIIHRDLKAGNVLLDESMNPKISDFGTARLYVEDQGSASRIVGTYGYMPPEYAKFGKISTKVDVFSFGVLLLEIISGRRNSASPSNPKRIEHLLSKAWKCWTMGQLRELIDPVLLRENGTTGEITRCIHIGLLCVQEKVVCRPTMSEVVLVLEGCSQILPPPSEPAYLIDIESDESTMEDVLIPRINASDTNHPTMLSSSVNENGTSLSFYILHGSSLKAGDPSSAWLSPSQNFAFGFQEIEPGNFLLAIWFNKIPENTITWSANRDHPAPRGSKAELTTTDRGGLVLTDPSGHEIWKAKLQAGSSSSSRGERITYAALLDTGNFVLATRASAVLWQSFDEPTDTLLPTQTLNPGGQLLARFTEKNHSGGRFTFKLQDTGDLALFTTNFPLFKSLNNYYWAYDTKGLGHLVVFNQSGFLYVAARNGSVLTDMFPGEVSGEQVVYQRVILEYDGVLRHYVYLNQSYHWSVRSFAPDNICTAVIQPTGRGVCGYNSYCKIENDRKPHCICPPGYTLLDSNDEMSGCFQNFPPQGCKNPSQENNQFNFTVLQDVDWPMADYEHFQNVSIDWCREVCLVDCFCAVGIFREGGDCWKKKLPLTNGKNDSTVERTAFIKVRTSGGFNGERHYKRSKSVLTPLMATSGSVNIILLGIIITGFSFFARRKNPKRSGNYNVRSFSYKELNEATNKFSEELGRGAFGVVYKGVLYDLSGSQIFIAVKKLYALTQDADKEFKTEVNSIGHTHHKNLVKLVGFCEEEEHRLLVYEFMSNGALSDFLDQPSKPAWEKRLRIAQGIARGLLYLHEDCSTQVIHCDIKPQNILLDDDHNARISDFGLAKLLRLDQTQTNTAPRGTRGYVAPEWFRNMPITAKVDAYSFGILLLEIISCRRNVRNENNEEGVVLLTDWAFDCYQMEIIGELVKDDVEALNDEQRLVSMVKIAIWCIQDDPNLRPTMRRVVEMLEGLVQVPEPPCPASYSTSHTGGSFILQTHPALAP